MPRTDRFKALPKHLQEAALAMLEPTLALLAGEVIPERVLQDAQWGGPQHDDTHTPDNWLSYIGKQMYKVQTEQDPDARRDAFVKIISLGVAALQSHDRLHPPAVAEERTCAACTLERFMHHPHASGADVRVVNIGEGAAPGLEEFLGALLSGGISGKGFNAR